MTLRRIGLGLLATALLALCVGAAAAAGRVTMAPDDVVGQAAPTLVPHSMLHGAGTFEGPVYRLPVDGIEVGYRQFGHGPDLIMVEGDTAPMSLWMPYLLHPLAKHFRVTIFDNRGVGYTTDDLAKPITVPLMARDTGALIEALGLVKPTLVGWSMGGEIGLTLAVRQPSVLGALVTTGGDAGSAHTVPPPPGLVRELANPKASTKVFLELLFPDTPAGGAATERFVKGYESIPQEKVSARTLKRQEVAEQGFLKYPGTWRGLPGIATPTLLTNGALDPGVPPVNARRLHARIPGSSLSVYAGAAHGMLFQDAERFAAQIAKFSARARAAAAAD
ncbi:MAG TPA: alpha/beta hydrolase [Solirubrobacterales bacterium]|jgi:pimeloyl-ACP methyl ester carboxylesterase|nr:alpha/beta hydrolase [Solirubrobacterales bacterium]